MPVGRSVLGAACAQLAELRRRGLELPGKIAVDVAGGQLARPGLARDVLAALERHDVPGSQLSIELTESTDCPTTTSPEPSSEVLHRLC